MPNPIFIFIYLYRIRWLSAASLNITMGDANYYTALLKQYYYGSNASKSR
jgi:hypothetical protein